MPDIVGTAYVRIRGVTTGLAGDIKDGLDKGFASGADLPDLGDNLTKASKKAATQAGDEGGKTFSQRMKKAFEGEWNKDQKFLAKKIKTGLSKFKIPGVVWKGALGIPALGGVIQLASSYILTLVGQLGFVVQAAAGAGVAVAGVFAAAGLAAIPLALAFKAQTEEMDEFKELATEQKDLWMEVGGAVQATFLPATAQAIVNMGDLRDEFTVFGQEVGTIFGEFTLGLSELLTSTESTGRWVEIFEDASVVFEFLLDTVNNLITALLPFLQAAMPIAVQFANAIRIASANFAFFMENAQESGALGATFQDWYDKAASIGRSIWNIVEALWEVFSVAAEVVAPQFDTLEAKTQGWVDFLRSAEGQSTLQSIFEQALPVAQELNGLLGDLAAIFTEVFVEDQGTDDMVEFIRSLREDWVPAIRDIVEALSAGTGDRLRELAEAFGAFLEQAAASGLLGTFVTVLTGLLEVLTELLSIPGMGDFIASFVTILTVIAFIAIPLSKLIGLAEALAVIIPVIAELFGVTLTVSLGAVFGWLILIVGVVAGVIAIWKNWDKIGPWLEAAWGKITEFFTNIWEAITEFFGGIPEWIEGVWTSILEFVTGIPEMLLGAATALWQWIVDAIPIALEKIAYFVGSVIGFLISLPFRILDLMVKAQFAIWGWIRDAVPKAIEWLGNMWVSIYDWIVQTIARLIIEGARMLKALVQWIVDAAKEAPGKLADFAESVWDWITEFVTGLPDRFMDAMTSFASFGEGIVDSIVEGLNNAISSVWSWGKNLLQAIVNGILDHAGPLRGALAGIFRGLGFSTGGGTGTGGQSSNDNRTEGLRATAFSTMTSPFTAMSSAFVPSPINTQSFSNVPTSQGGAINLLVKIGDEDITRIVDARVSVNDQALANALNVRRR